jgi:MSHA pilin protein MshA
MRNQQSGFTLIELVAVIVILGALAVVALPRFVNLQDEANEAALEGVAGGLSSAAATNLAGALAGSGDFTAVNSCSDVAKALQNGEVPNGYTVGGTLSGSNTGDSSSCSVTQTASGDSTVFTGYTVPNGPSP